MTNDLTTNLTEALQTNLEEARAKTTQELGDFIVGVKACFENEIEIRTVKESFFLPYLPHFLQEIVDENPIPWRFHWAHAAGGWYNPVNVVDDRAGEFLFTVPPLLNRDLLYRDIGVTIPKISDVMRGINDARNQSPYFGRQREMVDINAISRVIEANSLDPKRNQGIKLFAVIVKRYRSNTPTDNKTAESPNALGFDELFG